ncbi:MAG: NAD-dependent epimerase/dehydratase family protein [Bacteroidota bacterium]
MKKLNVLITGGAGFIGSHLAEAYLREGHRVVVVDDLSFGKRENVPAEAVFYQVDIRDRETLAGIFRAEGPELVSHHAAQMSVKSSTDDPSHDASINVLGLLNVLELSRRAGVGQLIFSSSGGTVYGEAQTIPSPEDEPLWPRTPYGITKMVAEHYLRYYGEGGLNWTIFRYGNVYGPRQEPHGEAGVVAIFAQRLLQGLPVQIHGDGEQVKDYVFVEDVVRANLLATGIPSGRIFNVGACPVSVNELYTQLAALSGATIPPERTPPRYGDIRRSVLDIGLIERELGWKPEVGLPDGLRTTYEYFKQRIGEGPWENTLAPTE